MEPKEKALREQGQIIQRSTGHGQNGHSQSSGQTQKINGSKGQHEGERYAKGQFLTTHKPAVFNTDIGDLAFRILSYAMARGSHWKIHPWQLQEQFGGRGRDAVRAALRELEAAGYARLLTVSQGRGRISSGWQIRRSPDAAWPELAVRSFRPPELQAAVNSGGKDSKESKKDQSGVSSSSANAYEEKRGVANADANATKNTLFSDVPRLPFPKSARAMYKTLERHSDLLDSYDTFADPDRDGNFFKDFSSRDWCYPRGRLVDNWLVAYIKRRQHITETFDQAHLLSTNGNGAKP